MNTFRYFDIMERYARGPMAPEERAEFERLLQHDRDLASEWADYQLIARSVRSTLRTRISAKPDIGQLVRDARELAQSEGLLFTDEDIWDYCRGQMPMEQSVVFERRTRTDAVFAAQVEAHRNVIKGIIKFAQRQKSIAQARDTLRNEGFTDSLHQQIKQDIADEKRRSLPPIEAQPKPKPGVAMWLFAMLGLLIVASAVFFFFRENPAPFDSKMAIEQARKDLPNNAAFQQMPSSNAVQAVKFLAQNLPDAALTHLHMMPQSERSPEATMLEGLAQMEKGNFEAAQIALDAALRAGTGRFLPTALWLAAICRVETKHYTQAKGHLQQLLADPYSTDGQRDAGLRLLAQLP